MFWSDVHVHYVIVAAFGFVYWLNATAGTKDSATYRVIFSGPVTGLRVGAPVLFNGIHVGEVSDLRLTDNPSEVAAMLAVSPKTPIRADTLVSLDYAGLTGIASVSLKGNLASAPPLPQKNGEPLTLRAATASGDMSSAVRETLAKADAVIAENQESLHKAIKNLEIFTDALARNGDKIDKLMANSTDAMASVKQLSDNLDRRTADITTGILQVTKIGKQADQRRRRRRPPGHHPYRHRDIRFGEEPLTNLVRREIAPLSCRPVAGRRKQVRRCVRLLYPFIPRETLVVDSACVWLALSACRRAYSHGRARHGRDGRLLMRARFVVLGRFMMMMGRLRMVFCGGVMMFDRLFDFRHPDLPE